MVFPCVRLLGPPRLPENSDVQQTETPESNGMLSVDEAARELGVHPVTVRRWVHDGLPAVQGSVVSAPAGTRKDRERGVSGVVLALAPGSRGPRRGSPRRLPGDV